MIINEGISKRNWTRDELIIAMNLYCQLSFGQFHKNHPLIIKVADKLGRSPSSLAMKLSNLASLDPEHQSRGIKGLKGASKLDKIIWQDFQDHWEAMVLLSEEKFNNLFSEPEEYFIKDEEKNTESLGIVKLRRGQSFFRKVVLAAYNYHCCITNNPITELLIASHILPWKSHPKERLNPHNGLCLAKTQDSAFDQGLITINEDYRLIISPHLYQYLPNLTLEQNFIQYEGKPIRLPERFNPDPLFLKYHREQIFKAV
jgi:putative restriction endonuclease